MFPHEDEPVEFEFRHRRVHRKMPPPVQQGPELHPALTPQQRSLLVVASVVGGILVVVVGLVAFVLGRIKR